MSSDVDGQLALVREGARRRPRRTAAPVDLAAEQPVARVAVDVPFAHLDRPFDYLVPEPMSAAARPGVRVRVRFAGQLVDGFVLDRVDDTGHEGRLSRLERVVSPEPVLSHGVAALAREVADRYGGSLADVLRLAVPPRHAATEKRVAKASVPTPGPTDPGPWAGLPRGAALLAAVEGGQPARASWTCPPGVDWVEALATLVHTALAAGRGAVVLVPDGRDAARVSGAVEARAGTGSVALLSADLGPAERYARWLAIRRGTVRAVVGPRAAAFAPVADLGLAVVWDDGDDLHAEQRAPYPHAREVLALRSHLSGCAFVVGGHACTAEAAQLVATGWAFAVGAARADVRRLAPTVRVSGDDADLAKDPAARTARLPSVAWSAIRVGLERGPVLVQVPRRGYVPGLACASCRRAARCDACSGPLSATSGHSIPVCGWCGRAAGGWQCSACGSRRTRALVVGSRRTAEELGRAFPSVPVRTSGRDEVLDVIGSRPALVVATPGAEPVAEGGYAAAVLLDGWAMLSRPDLRVEEEALRRWLNAASLVRGAPDGGAVVVCASSDVGAVQALVRWDPVGFATRELDARLATRMPPAVRVVEITGPTDAVTETVALAELPADAEVLGPVTVPSGRDRADRGRRDEPGGGTAGDTVRALVRVPRAQGAAAAAAVHAAVGVRTARKAAHAVRVRVDPADLG